MAQSVSRSDWLSLLRERDPDRYTACLYLPESVRADAACLYAFDVEIAAIPELISEPLPGEVRLQFWRDLLAKGEAGGAGPLAEDLLTVIEQHSLPVEVLHNYLNARIFDLYHDPMPDMGTYEGYLGETHSAFLQLVALCVGAERSTYLADASGHAGVAYGTTRLLSTLAWHHHNRRTYIPADVLAREGLTAEDWLSPTPTRNHVEAVRAMCVLARYHKQAALDALRELPKPVRSVFLPVAYVEPTLRLIEKQGKNIFQRPVSIGNLRRQWAALTWALRQ